MEFGFDEAQRDLHARMVALGERAQAAPEKARLSLLAEGGALGLSIPREYGGGGFDLVTTAHAYEGLGRSLRDGGVLLAAGAHLFGVAMMIVKVGTEAQKARWLPRLASGEVIATVGATEEGSGSDIAAVAGVAEPIADAAGSAGAAQNTALPAGIGGAAQNTALVSGIAGTAQNTALFAGGAAFRVTASKRYVTAAERAGLFFVVARDGAEGRGLTGLLVPREANGITVGAPLAVMGLRNAGLAPVAFEGTVVGAEALLGRAGAGLATFQIAMTYERALILAFRLGAMDTDLREAIAFARGRRLGGAAIAKHQAVSHRVARMRMRIETARLMTYRAAWALDRGERGQIEAALAKWHVAEAATASALDALKLRGGAGFLEESGLMQTLDDTLGNGFHSGTEDVLPNIVAGWLGL